ncbi:hypothetical protein [Roseateles koreensis]|uniref:Uncharacterized protein n=1 Tax=Roseateles koreensis TaxID=2987526 RepID=A0ABT5KXN6_9BURK|nr:hypothetical protein [Roseateles koreensis]MDC8787118.1 hypothetical protein [Roseateles koreensis]
MIIETGTSRAQIPLEQRVEIVSANLMRAYAKIKPGADRSIFEKEVIGPLLVSGYRADELLEDLMSMAGKSDVANVDQHIIQIACLYTAQAAHALKDGDRNLAAGNLIEAYFWSGVVNASGALDLAEQAAYKDARSSVARSGSDARKARIDKSKSRAFELEREMRPANGWPSLRQAAITVSKALLKTPVSDGHKLSPDQAQKTVSDWLKELPDAAELFPKTAAKKK